MVKHKLYKDFEKAQLECVKNSINKNGSWNSKHFVHCKADLLDARLKQRKEDYKLFNKIIDDEIKSIIKLNKDKNVTVNKNFWKAHIDQLKELKFPLALNIETKSQESK